MNDFISEQFNEGNITLSNLKLYLKAQMISQDFYNQLTNTDQQQSSSSSSTNESVQSNSNSFNPVA